MYMYTTNCSGKKNKIHTSTAVISSDRTYIVSYQKYAPPFSSKYVETKLKWGAGAFAEIFILCIYTPSLCSLQSFIRTRSTVVTNAVAFWKTAAERDLLLFCYSSTHSITHSSRSQYASYGGRHCLSRMSSILASYTVDHSLSGVQAHAILRLSTCGLRSLEIEHMCYTISRLRTRVTQSRDCLRNLGILRVTQSRDSANSQIARNIYTREKYLCKNLGVEEGGGCILKGSIFL